MRVKDYYKGKNVLVTGVTGLVGKALVEKLLRSCPEVGNIYCVIRSKRGVDPQERWKQTIEGGLFDLLKQTSPESLEKCVVFPGESTAENFGLSEEHQKIIIDNVNIIFHVAASVNFSDTLVKSVNLNMKNTLSLLELSRKIKKLELFVHVSTAYSNFPLSGEIEEKVYDSYLPWRDVMKMVEDGSDNDAILNMQPKLLNGHLSSYTLTKNLAENMVVDYSHYFPVIIIRPSLVLGTYSDPMPGWVDMDHFLSLYGKGVRMGILRVLLANASDVLNHIPLDLCVKAMIVAPWKKSMSSKKEVEVYCCQMTYTKNQEVLTFDTTLRTSYPLAFEYPDKEAIWYPFYMTTTNYTIFKILYLILHIFPAFFIDMALKATGRTPRLLKIYSNIWSLNELNKYYHKPHHWFSTSNYQKLGKSVKEEDKEDFSMDTSHYDGEEYILNNCRHHIKYHWKAIEEAGDPRIHARLQRLKIIHYTVCSLVAVGVGYLTVNLFQMLI